MLVQVGRRAMEGAKSAVSHGWLFARPACTSTLKIPKEPAGLISRKRLFASFLVFSKMKASGRECPISSAKAPHPPGHKLLSPVKFLAQYVVIIVIGGMQNAD